MHRDLSKKLVSSVRTDDPAEFFLMKQVLDLAAGSLPNDGSLPAGDALNGFRLAQSCLFEMRQGRRNLRADGVLYRGHLAWLTGEQLGALQQELEQQQPRAVRARWGQHIARGGPVARSIAGAPELRALVEDQAGPVLDEVEITSIFYDEPGAEIRPHVDTDKFSVNANLLVSHTADRQRRSELVLYPVGEAPQRLVFEAGELLLFYADTIVHARTPIAEGERVRAISFGFRLRDELRHHAI